MTRLVKGLHGMMNRPPLEKVKRGSKADYQELFKVDYRKVLRALKIPVLLIIYGWIGISLLGVLIKTLTVLEDTIKPTIIGSIVSTGIFAVIVFSWLYAWRIIAVYYRNKYLKAHVK